MGAKAGLSIISLLSGKCGVVLRASYVYLSSQCLLRTVTCLAEGRETGRQQPSALGLGVRFGCHKGWMRVVQLSVIYHSPLIPFQSTVPVVSQKSLYVGNRSHVCLLH